MGKIRKYVLITCEHCGNKKNVRSDSAKKQRFCSRKCFYEYQKEQPKKRKERPSHKICTSCHRELPYTEEFFHRRGDIFKPQCKECRSLRKDRSKKRSQRSKIVNGQKLCVSCEKYYPATVEYFHHDKRGVGGLVSVCKKCRGMDFGISHGNKVLDIPEGYHYCCSCKEIKPENEFYLKKTGYSSNCKKCYIFSRNVDRLKRDDEKLNYTSSDWKNCMRHFDYRCAYCGKRAELSMDHFIPRKDGGLYSVDNIVPACSSCNSSKNMRNFFEWYPDQKFYSKQREEMILNYLDLKPETIPR